jgi:hypothetical protein
MKWAEHPLAHLVVYANLSTDSLYGDQQPSQKMLIYNAIRVECNSLHEQSPSTIICRSTSYPKSEMLNQWHVHTKRRLWQFRSMKHSNDHSHWQPSKLDGKSNMSTKLCTFFCQSSNYISLLVSSDMNLDQYRRCNTHKKIYKNS